MFGIIIVLEVKLSSADEESCGILWVFVKYKATIFPLHCSPYMNWLDSAIATETTPHHYGSTAVLIVKTVLFGFIVSPVFCHMRCALWCPNSSILVSSLHITSLKNFSSLFKWSCANSSLSSLTLTCLFSNKAVIRGRKLCKVFFRRTRHIVRCDTSVPQLFKSLRIHFKSTRGFFLTAITTFPCYFSDNFYFLTRPGKFSMDD